MERARWRRITFRASLLLLGLALIGAALAAYAKERVETGTFTNERCLVELIKSTEGSSGQETKWMQQILTKVLLQSIPVKDAIAALPLKQVNQRLTV